MVGEYLPRRFATLVIVTTSDLPSRPPRPSLQFLRPFLRPSPNNGLRRSGTGFALVPSFSRLSLQKDNQDGGNASSCNLAYYSRDFGNCFAYCYFYSQQKSKEEEEG